MRFLVLSLLTMSACSGGALGRRDPIQGSLDRDGEILDLSLRKGQFERVDTSTLHDAFGFLKTPSDGTLLVYAQMQFINPQNFPEGATELPVGPPSEISVRDGYGVGVTWIERRVTGEQEQIYRHDYNGGAGGEVTGSLTIHGTDWQTYFEGTLEAEIDNNEFGYRGIVLDWNLEDLVE